jgi:CRISPR type IV-associated protein Csf3
MNEPFKNLRIRAYLKTGVISDQYLPLDGILYYHLVRREMGEELITKSRESNVRQGANITLPIKKSGPKNEFWFYACSFAQFPQSIVEDSSFKVKSGDWLRHDNHFNAKKKIDITRGKFKNAHIKLYYRHCTYIDWYCVGWPDKIAELLQFCTNIGKNTGDGWGEVLKWEITEWPEDWSVRGMGNKLMRNVPMQQDKPGFMYGLRPSYWNPRHISVCKMPD